MGAFAADANVRRLTRASLARPIGGSPDRSQGSGSRAQWIAGATDATVLPVPLSTGVVLSVIAFLHCYHMHRRLLSRRSPSPSHIGHRHASRVGALLALFALFALSLAVGCAGRSMATTMRPSVTSATTAPTRRDVITAVQTAIRSQYLYADRIPRLVAALEHERVANGADVQRSSDLATRLTAVMQAVSPDGHLYVRDDSARYAAAMAPTRSDHGLRAFQRSEARRRHHGIATLEVLPSGLRYLRVSGFVWTPGETPAAFDAAIRALAEGDALIIDLRGNTGGASEAADYLLNALLPPRTTLYSYEGMDAQAVSRTGATRHSGVLAGKPCYVLVDGHTGSAAEAFAYALQQARAARIVGDPTFGAANNNREIPIAPRFILSLSYRRPISPVSGTNWEGSGVRPDIAVPAVDARAVAELEALDRLSATPELATATRNAAHWARAEAQARLHPPAWTAARLQRLAGTYGTTRVDYVGDGLRLTRLDRPKWHAAMRLRPLTDDGLFAVDAFAFDDLRVRITEQQVEYLFGRDDAREVVTRDQKGSP